MLIWVIIPGGHFPCFLKIRWLRAHRLRPAQGRVRGGHSGYPAEFDSKVVGSIRRQAR